MKQYRTLPVVLMAALALTGNTAARAPEAVPSDIVAANKRLGRGINLGNALDAPKEGEWGVTLKEGYFKAIKEAGRWKEGK